MPQTINIASGSRPPLNLFEARRAELTPDTWTTIYDVPEYGIPANGPVPAKTINTAAIMTGIVVSNITAGDMLVSLRVVDTNNSNTVYLVLNEAPLPPNDFVSIGLDRQVLMTGEQFQVLTTGTSVVHFSFILNQREEFITD